MVRKLREQLAARAAAQPPRPAPEPWLLSRVAASSEPRLLPRGVSRPTPAMFSEIPVIRAPSPVPEPTQAEQDEERLRQIRERLLRSRAAAAKPAETAWSKFLVKHAETPEVLAAIEAETTKVQEAIEQEHYEQEAQAMRERARAMWQTLRDHAQEMGKTRWRRIIDYALLDHMRAEKERLRRERDALEAAMATAEAQAAAEVRRLAEEEARRLAALEELRRQAMAMQRLKKASQKLLAERKKRRMRQASAVREREPVRVKALRAPTLRPIQPSPATQYADVPLYEKRRREPRGGVSSPEQSPMPSGGFAAAAHEQRSATVPLSSRLTAPKLDLTMQGDANAWLQKMPQFLPRDVFVPSTRGFREKLMADAKSSSAGSRSFSSMGTFVEHVCVRPKTASPLPGKLLRGSQSMSDVHGQRQVSKLQSDGNKASLISELDLDGSLSKSPSAKRPLPEIHRVKGAVPFHSSGLLVPLHRTSHATDSSSPADSTRHMVLSMNGVAPRSLPIVEMVDLKKVLDVSGMDSDRWPSGAVRALLEELTASQAVLVSLPNDQAETLQLKYDYEMLFASPSVGRPPCSCLMLKRNVLYLHILSDCGRFELLERIVDDGQVQYHRLSARLAGDAAPSRYAIALVAEALGVDPNAVMLLDAQPLVSQGDAQPSAYPRLLCEHTLYVLRMGVEGLPPHSFRAGHKDWVWRPAAVGQPTTHERSSSGGSKHVTPGLATRRGPAGQRIASSTSPSCRSPAGSFRSDPHRPPSAAESQSFTSSECSEDDDL